MDRSFVSSFRDGKVSKNTLPGASLCLAALATALFAAASSSRAEPADITDPVSARIKPDIVYRERRGPNLRLNFDVELRNRSAQPVRVTYIEMRLFDANRRLVTRRHMGSNGLPGPIAMLPDDVIPAKGSLYLFNPFPDTEQGLDVDRVELRVFHTAGNLKLNFQPVPVPGPPLRFPPIEDSAYVFSGNDLFSHHRRVSLTNQPARELGMQHVTQRYALDLTAVDPETGDLARANGAALSDWHGFGLPVLAPAAGKVTAVRSDMPDNGVDANGNRVFIDGFTSYGEDAGLGNYLILELESGGGFLLMSHFEEGSIRLGVGDKVKAGDLLGRIGLSGDTAYPHLHMQRQDGVDPIASRPLPITFECVQQNGRRIGHGSVDTGDFIAVCDDSDPPGN